MVAPGEGSDDPLLRLVQEGELETPEFLVDTRTRLQLDGHEPITSAAEFFDAVDRSLDAGDLTADDIDVAHAVATDAMMRNDFTGITYEEGSQGLIAVLTLPNGASNG